MGVMDNYEFKGSGRALGVLTVRAASAYLLQGIPSVGYHMIWWNTLFSWGLGCEITWTHFFFQKQEDIRPFFESQLKACGVEYFDACVILGTS